MKKQLKRTKIKVYYYKDDKKIIGAHENIRGDVSEIRGDISGISGDVSEVSGDVSEVNGDVSGIRGDIDLCEITKEDRQKGINIDDLID